MGYVKAVRNGGDWPNGVYTEWGGGARVMGQIWLITVILEYRPMSQRWCWETRFLCKNFPSLKYCARQTEHFSGQVVVCIIIYISLHVDGGTGDHFIIILSNLYIIL